MVFTSAFCFSKFLQLTVIGLPGEIGAPVQWRAEVAFKHGHETVPTLHHNMEGRTVPASRRRHKRATPTTVQVSLIWTYNLYYFQVNVYVIQLVISNVCMQNKYLRTFQVDGVWVTWGSWGTCTVTCGGGSQTRSRTCTNPAPQYGGAACPGSGGSSQACNTQHCPSKYKIMFSVFIIFQKYL